ncbi:MAG: hypothetical protein M0R40_09820 [Firmicutes bacterium]|nr:hypothetical protein [Bacillota bacterium]
MAKTANSQQSQKEDVNEGPAFRDVMRTYKKNIKGIQSLMDMPGYKSGKQPALKEAIEALKDENRKLKDWATKKIAREFDSLDKEVG